MVDVTWDYGGGIIEQNNYKLSYPEPGAYTVSVTGETLEDPPRLAYDSQLITVHPVVPAEMETRIDFLNIDYRSLTHNIWYDITNYGSPSFDYGGRYGSGVLACSAVTDYGDGEAVYSDNYAAADNGYLQNWLNNEDTFIHEYAVAGQYRLTVSTACEFTGTALAPVDGPATTITRDLVIGDNLTIIYFESTAADDYSSLSIENFEFSPTFNTVVMVYDDGDTNSISPRWGDSMQLKRNDGMPFNLQSFKYRGRWQGINSTAKSPVRSPMVRSYTSSLIMMTQTGTSNP